MAISRASSTTTTRENPATTRTPEPPKAAEPKPAETAGDQAPADVATVAPTPRAEPVSPGTANLISGLADNFGPQAEPETPAASTNPDPVAVAPASAGGDAGSAGTGADENAGSGPSGNEGPDDRSIFDRIGDIFGKEGGEEEELTPEEQRQQSVNDAIDSDDPVTFETSEGEEVEVGIDQTGDNTYEVEVDGETFEVEIGDDYDRDQVLANLVDYYSEIPPHLREALDRVVFNNGDFDNDFDGFVPANSGTIEFDAGAFSDDGTLDRSLFHHEFGHALGNHLEDQDDGGFENFRERFTGEGGEARPDDFEDAYEADGSPDFQGNSAGDNALNEEFADGWQFYLDLALNDPEGLEEFREMYPETAALYDEIYAA